MTARIFRGTAGRLRQTGTTDDTDGHGFEAPHEPRWTGAPASGTARCGNMRLPALENEVARQAGREQAVPEAGVPVQGNLHVRLPRIATMNDHEPQRVLLSAASVKSVVEFILCSLGCLLLKSE